MCREQGTEAPLTAARQSGAAGGRVAARQATAGRWQRGDGPLVTGVACSYSAAGSISDVHAIMIVSCTVTPSLKELA